MKRMKYLYHERMADLNAVGANIQFISTWIIFYNLKPSATSENMRMYSGYVFGWCTVSSKNIDAPNIN